MNKNFDIIVRHVNGRGWLGIVESNGGIELYRTWDFKEQPLDAYNKAFTWLGNNSHLIVDSDE
jgi:hypothetical protein